MTDPHPNQYCATRISIITVCFNSAKTIRATIESVLDQDYPDLEYLVVDGGSKDATMDIVREYQDRIAVVVSEPDRGIYDAMNKGIALASGDIIGMLNSDDIYADQGTVRRLVSRLMQTQVDCVFANLVVVDPEDTRRVLRHYDSGMFRPSRLRFGWMPAHPTFMAKRELYRKHGGFSLEYRIASDFEMMVRLFYSARVRYSHLPSVEVRMRAGGLSSANLRSRWALNKEIVRACRAYGLRTSLPLVLLKVPFKLMELVRRPAKAGSASKLR